jgi:hypothetical protein
VKRFPNKFLLDRRIHAGAALNRIQAVELNRETGNAGPALD